MTNLEKYRDELEPYVYSQDDWAISKGKIVDCSSISCDDCAFFSYEECVRGKLEWIKKEYKEPGIDWSKVAVDTPILVSMDEVSWYKRHFAKYEDGKVYVWKNGTTSWSGITKVGFWDYAKLANMEEEKTNE